MELIQTMYGVAVVPLIIAVVALAKQSGINQKYGGILALVLGLCVGFGYGLVEAGWNYLQCAIVGSALGLSAAGTYSTIKNAKEAQNEE